MLATAGALQKKRDDLKSKRASLFAKYSRHPQDYQLASEIRKIDDEIADCTQKMEEETRSERKSLIRKLAETRK